MNKPIVYAHRGASAYAPENTESAFLKAIEFNAGGIELDVQLSKDGHVVVIHDEKVDRTSDGTGWVKDMTLSELKNMDFGSWFHKSFAHEDIMTLEEVLDLLQGKDWNGILNIEIKSGPILYKGLEEKVINLIEEYGVLDHIIISSFNHYSLVKVKELEANIKTGILYMAGLVDPWEYAKRINANAIHPLFYSALPFIIKGCKENGIMVNPYTVDSPQTIKELTLAGVDGIITNVPDKANEVIGSL